MTYEYEEAAALGGACPKNLPLADQLKFYVLRGIYSSLQAGTVQKAEGAAEKSRIMREIDELCAARQAERRRWEENQERTFAAERALTAYRIDHTLERADELVSRLEWLSDECARPALSAEHGANCPACGTFFEQAHADRRPAYCEICGCRLSWPRGTL